MNNVVRVAYQALASVLGGVQSMFTCAWDEAFTIPSAETAELALRTQQVLAEETGAGDVVDPLGGSWFVEELTDQIEREAKSMIDDIEATGGMVHAIETGQIQALIADRAYEQQLKLESGELVVVGVNKYRRDETPPEIEFYEIDEQERAKQIESLHSIRSARDAAEASRTLDALEQAASGTDNLMPYLVDCALAYCTLGEMVSVFRKVFGEFREPAFG